MTSEAVKVFYSYSRKDQVLREKLDQHLAPLKFGGLISTWHDLLLEPGSDWRKDIGGQLDTAHIILLLVSANFLSSEYCYSIELKRALERDARQEACVIPVILEPCDWKRDWVPFSKLTALPNHDQAITEWENKEAAFFTVARNIGERVLRLVQIAQDKAEKERIQREQQVAAQKRRQQAAEQSKQQQITKLKQQEIERQRQKQLIQEVEKKAEQQRQEAKQERLVFRTFLANLQKAEQKQQEAKQERLVFRTFLANLQKAEQKQQEAKQKRLVFRTFLANLPKAKQQQPIVGYESGDLLSIIQRCLIGSTPPPATSLLDLGGKLVYVGMGGGLFAVAIWADPRDCKLVCVKG